MRFLAPVLLLFGALAMHAQSSAGFGSISGSVRDASGKLVPGARVVISNPANGVTRNLVSNEAGAFTAPALVPGTGYAVTVDMQGFKRYELRDLELAVGQNL